MHKIAIAFLTISFVLVAGMGTAAAQYGSAAPPAVEKSFGAGVTQPATAVGIDAAITKAGNGKKAIDVVVKGTITKVCRKKGCWFVLQGTDKSRSVRITMKDYGFFVPTDCDGREAIVAGQLEVKTISEKMRKHLAEDEGKDSSGIKGDIQEFGLVATGVVLR
jgi:hypothetical protein